MCTAAGSGSRSRSGHPEEKAPGGEDQEAEQVSVKERMAMYQAAVSSKESGASSSAVVRPNFLRDGGVRWVTHKRKNVMFTPNTIHASFENFLLDACPKMCP